MDRGVWRATIHGVYSPWGRKGWDTTERLSFSLLRKASVVDGLGIWDLEFKSWLPGLGGGDDLSLVLFSWSELNLGS